MSDAKNVPLENPLSPQDREPTTVATPEGDNEYGPDTPLQPTPDGLHTPPGLATSPYDADKDADKHEEEKPSGIVKFIDEVARGEFM